jgi:hypothetical protein
MASILLDCFGERRDMFESRPAAAKADPMPRRLATVWPSSAISPRCPLGWRPTLLCAQSRHEGAPDGRGLRLMRGLASGSRYRHDSERNRVGLRFLVQ